MKTIQTGKGTIPLMTLIAIWSISLVVNLPGLAISPMLGELHNIFPNASELEVQLLTILPNLLIIPFVLISGHLSVSKSKIMIVVVSLIIYLSSGLLYLFASTMTELIIVSCLLGVGCGLLIPLAAGLIADTFTGKYRLKQLGIKSGIANISLVMATFVVGWLGGRNWHLPFLVYLLPVIPL
ncbi:MAG: MFS transporter, partial [Bacteroidaceae bacterium]